MSGNAGAFRLRGYNDHWDGWLARVLERPFKPLENELWQAGYYEAAALSQDERGKQFAEQMRRTSIGLPTYEPMIIVHNVTDVA